MLKLYSETQLSCQKGCGFLVLCWGELGVLENSHLKITDEFCHSWPPLMLEMFGK